MIPEALYTADQTLLVPAKVISYDYLERSELTVRLPPKYGTAGGKLATPRARPTAVQIQTDLKAVQVAENRTQLR
jgi:hypothetical protein